MSRQATIHTPADFWAQTRRDENGCWLWTGTIHRHTGYGRAGYQGKTWIASRLAYELAHGAIPDGLFVCHRCDVRACVNPEHLFLGTAGDNANDRTVKGRSAKRLSLDDAVRIRALYATGNYTHRQLAAVFGVAHSAITSVLNYRSHWSA